MDDNVWLWLGLTLFFLIIMAFYSMTEFACVSFNRMRLQYFVSQGNRKARWLEDLLKKPARLFGTTLIGVNIAMMLGSECSRRMYSAMGLPPDLAPLTEVVLVIIIGDLAPMFAARRHPEAIGMMGIPVVYLSAQIMKPLLVCVDYLLKGMTFLSGKQQRPLNEYFVSREELQKTLEEHEGGTVSRHFSDIVSHIFDLRDKRAGEIMTSLSPLVPSHTTLAHLREIFKNTPLQSIPVVYHGTPSNVIGTLLPRDVLSAPENHVVQEHCRAPWFITEDSKVSAVLAQFRENHMSIAVVLNKNGDAVGVVTLNAILQEIFGEAAPKTPSPKKEKIVERTAHGDMDVHVFEGEFGVSLQPTDADTLSEFMTERLGHIPEPGETVVVGPLTLTVEQTSLLGAKTIGIRET